VPSQITCKDLKVLPTVYPSNILSKPMEIFIKQSRMSYPRVFTDRLAGGICPQMIPALCTRLSLGFQGINMIIEEFLDWIQKASGFRTTKDISLFKLSDYDHHFNLYWSESYNGDTSE